MYLEATGLLGKFCVALAAHISLLAVLKCVSLLEKRCKLKCGSLLTSNTIHLRKGRSLWPVDLHYFPETVKPLGWNKKHQYCTEASCVCEVINIICRTLANLLRQLCLREYDLVKLRSRDLVHL